MTLAQILILAVIAILINSLRAWRSGAMLAASVLAVYWLQPRQALDSLTFWLPTILLVISVSVWAATSSFESQERRENWAALAILIATIAAVNISRHLGFDYLIAADTPRAQWLLFVVSALLLAFWGRSRLRGRFSRIVLAAAALGIVGLFLLIKIPSALSTAVAWLSQLRGKETIPSPVSWLGFSYISFRLLHTIFDRLAGRLPRLSLMTYLNYAIFFPSFVSGPIDRVERFQKDLAAPLSVDADGLTEAGTRLFAGLFKKFVLADALGWIALNQAYLTDAKSGVWLWLFLYAYSLQIFFDFSGYTDMAIGLGRLMGIRLPENFNAPYLKPNLSQFWNSWHITLTQWFRSYFFNPLTRRMRAARRPLPVFAMIFLSQVATMVLIGLWHGATINYLLWGLWHGAGLFVQNRWSAWTRPYFVEAPPLLNRVARYAGVFVTFHFVSFSWLFFIFPDASMARFALLRLIGVQ